MKTLLLLRHAKSDWDDTSLPDFDRPLADRGKRDAPRIGEALAARGAIPDRIFSSPATRARQTIEAVVKSAKLSTNPEFDESIYGATAGNLISFIKSLPDSSSCVLLVGHNPSFEEVASRLSGEHVPMPTAALACIEFPTDHWRDVEEGHGTLAWRLSPKHLDYR
jgi:phosphohistidine phosphatase